MEPLTVVKIGGNVIDNAEALERFVADFSALQGAKVLVHGGGKVASQLLNTMGIEVKMHDGRRITDSKTIDVVTMVYGGLINKGLVAKLQAKGCNALGLSGADGNAIRATKRKANPIDWGFVGDVLPSGVNVQLLDKLLDGGITPIFCALTHDVSGSLLNTNADTVASVVAVAMAEKYAVRLVYCFEKDGVLDSNEELISEITPDIYATLKGDKVVKDGMLPKLDNAFAALDGGVCEVIIKHARNLLNITQTTIKR